MLKLGYLASNSIYVCTEHKPDILNRYYDNLDTVLKLVADCMNEKQDIHKLLEHQVCFSGFKRLN